MAVSSDYYSLVCAIDFGTAFSGYAYSQTAEYVHDPLNIAVPNWETPLSVQISYKTPTTILLNKDQKFVAFGYEAESKYAELAEEEENEDYFYIQRFKMLLYNTLRRQVSYSSAARDRFTSDHIFINIKISQYFLGII